ncbi:hypothetical protein FO519_000785 [Halicephalobus sp. NKZ332]|nr:hypothetical protein FO519_000785 [Halicephalobus sp. NKZ332]
MYLNILIFISLILFESVFGDPSVLLDHLLDSYDKRIRPFSDVDRPVMIEMTIVLGILTELKENQQLMSVVISHVQKWTDPKLAWDIEKFNGVSEVVIPQSLIWVPKLFIYNSMDTKAMLTEDRYDVRVSHKGKVKINIPQYVSCICRLKIDMFPFDTQFCAIALASPLLNTEEMDVNATKPPRDSYFAGNAEWEVMNVTVKHMRFMEEGEFRAEIHYILHLHRRPVYYLTVIVAPTFLISALSLLGIFSPGYYIIVVIVLCAVAVGVSMGFLALSRQFIQTSKMPSAFAYKCLWMTPRKRQIDYWQASDFNENCDVQLPKFPDLIAIYNQIHEIAAAQTTFRKKLEKQRWNNMVETEWNRLFSRFDYFFLFLFQALNLIVLLLFLRNAWLPVPDLPVDFTV